MMIGLFNPETDLLSLQYDHAPDKDDGHATVAGKVLVDIYGINHIAVGGAHGKNGGSYNPASELVMDATWGEGAWINANDDRQSAIREMGTAWLSTIQNGGQVFVAEGGQSDASLGAAQYVKNNGGDPSKITIVQHSNWNINNYGNGVLAGLTNLGVKHLKIDDGNQTNKTANLNTTNNSPVSDFVSSALASPWSNAWQAAFNYYDPNTRLDFSDTVETLYILGVGLNEVANVTDFADQYLDTAVSNPDPTNPDPTTPDPTTPDPTTPDPTTPDPTTPDPTTPDPTTPLTIRIEAEDYASGGQNISFFDTTAENIGGAYRNDEVDLEPTSDVGGGFNVGWIKPGEWLTYDLNLPQDGQYNLVARVATARGGDGSFNVTLGDQTIPFEFGTTGDWQSWQDVVVKGINLTAGTQPMRVDIITGDFNFNYLELISDLDTAVSTPEPTTPEPTTPEPTTPEPTTPEPTTPEPTTPEPTTPAQPSNPDDLVGNEVTVGYFLVDTDSDTTIDEITEGGLINLAEVGSSLSIIAEPNKAVSKVDFNLTGPININLREKVRPYALAGDLSGDYTNAGLVEGDYNLIITTYDLNGQVSGSDTTNFTVVDTPVTV